MSSDIKAIAGLRSWSTCGYSVSTRTMVHRSTKVTTAALTQVFSRLKLVPVAPEQAAEIIRALPPFVQAVGLFVNETAAQVNAIADRCRLDIVQLHGDESPAYCNQIERRVVKVFRMKDRESLATMQEYRVAGYLLDAWSSSAYGGTGHVFDWELIRDAGRCGPLILAGGLTPENVAEAVIRVKPYAVDVSSGVESAPGRKDPARVRAFIARAKEALR